MSRRLIRYDDLYRFKFVSDPRLSPDGTRVLFTVSNFHSDRSANTYQSHIWCVKSSGGKPWQYTHSNEAESYPRWSPDGNSFLFLSGRDAEKEMQGRGQIWIMGEGQGEARRITEEERGVQSAAWSPDGKWIAFIGRVPTEHVKAGSKTELKKTGKRITRFSYRFDSAGYHHDFNRHVFVVPARGGRSRQVTEGDWNVEDFAWATDGRSILITGNRERAFYEFKRLIYRVPFRGGKEKVLSHLPGHLWQPAPSPDNKLIAFVGDDFTKSIATNDHLYVISKRGGRARKFTGAFDISIDQSVMSDSRYAGVTPPPVWTRDGQNVRFLVTKSGRSIPHEFNLRDKTLTPLINHPGTIDSVTYSSDGKAAAFCAMTPTKLNEIYFWCSGAVRQLTRFNAAILNKLRLSEPKQFFFRATDKRSVEGWILYPPRMRKTGKIPAVMQIHGGPRAAYGLGFLHEFHLLNAAGFAVFYINPRGSSSYGERWAHGVIRRYGEQDYRDIMEGVKHVVRKERVDRRRLGVTGGSYGGFMTNWVVGHSRVFKAACTRRSISNWVSFAGTSDIGWGFASESIGKMPWQNLNEYWRRSPMAYVERINAPLLIIHAEEDYRCPIEQGEQLYAALKYLGRDVELLRFPGESHELSRSGKPLARIENLKAIVDWFKRKL